MKYESSFKSEADGLEISVMALIPDKKPYRAVVQLVHSWNSSYNDVRNEWRTALAAIASHRIDVRPLISHRFPLSEADKAFGVMRERKEFFNKVMFINR